MGLTEERAVRDSAEEPDADHQDPGPRLQAVRQLPQPDLGPRPRSGRAAASRNGSAGLRHTGHPEGIDRFPTYPNSPARARTREGHGPAVGSAGEAAGDT